MAERANGFTPDAGAAGPNTAGLIGAKCDRTLLASATLSGTARPGVDPSQIPGTEVAPGLAPGPGPPAADSALPGAGLLTGRIPR